ncbi:hypothetical protein CYLTODRAFT_442133 [Cylindrobasidium torrendii FP15055 ss-10]|uniref:Uncharacterized protein n=1 Tax=Cylindrobasidium torrendii FP15055 ss-10 TaxID=1314674 RepID=A0A0D7BKW2_9AGAR|nr:hypothetical protein CYLTODRAFT_442133 [Cylindrobasidium torrendii FP15055 ss-10]
MSHSAMILTPASPQANDDDILSLFSPPPYANTPPYSEQVPQRPTLPKLVALPQTQTEFDASFVRAYPPSLQPFSVSVQEWMQFCDGLGIAMAGSPPLAVVNTVGKIIGFSPGPVAMITGTVMQVGAQVGTRLLSKSVTDKYLARANKEYFFPRGLSVRLCKTPAVRLLARPDNVPSPTSTLSQVAKTAQTVGLHLPIVRKIMARAMSPVDPIDRSKSTFERQIAALDCDGAIAELDFNVPPPKAPEGMSQKAQELESTMNQRRAKRREERAQRQIDDQRTSRNEEHRRSSAERPTKGERKEERKEEKRERKEERKEEKRERKEERKEDKRERKEERREDKRERKEEKKAMREERRDNRRVEREAKPVMQQINARKEQSAFEGLIWLVVLTNEQDAAIEHREVADSEYDSRAQAQGPAKYHDVDNKRVEVRDW